MIKVRNLNTKQDIVSLQIQLYLKKKSNIDKTIVKGFFNGKDMLFINGQWEEATKKLV
ncbi:MAG: hypothetical protein ACW98D_17920 [Promethearchaeota archaeon]|jgi:hypothetical protein